MVESFGCVPETVDSGAKAVTALTKGKASGFPHRLVLLDMCMPEMSGEDTVKAIKSDPMLQDVSIIILTSVGDRSDARRLEGAGCSAVLLKPIKQSKLLDAIMDVLHADEPSRGEQGSCSVAREIEENRRLDARILLAEDNPVNQKVAVRMLEKMGCTVETVENGLQATQAATEKRHDLILMDVQMPGMDGFEATRAIRQKEGDKRRIPIIAMTAHAMSGDRERCLEAGMDDYIPKPVQRKQLFEAIEKWVRNDKALMPEPAPAPLDLEAALPRFGKDLAFFVEMLEEFLRYAPPKLEELITAVEKRNTEAVSNLAHSLKGSAANFAAEKTVSLALALEQMGREGILTPDAPHLTEELQVEMGRMGEYASALKSQEDQQRNVELSLAARPEEVRKRAQSTAPGPGVVREGGQAGERAVAHGDRKWK